MKKVVSSLIRDTVYTLEQHVQLQKTRGMSIENISRPERVEQESKSKHNAMKTKNSCPLWREVWCKKKLRMKAEKCEKNLTITMRK